MDMYSTHCLAFAFDQELHIDYVWNSKIKPLLFVGALHFPDEL